MIVANPPAKPDVMLRQCQRRVVFEPRIPAAYRGAFLMDCPRLESFATR